MFWAALACNLVHMLWLYCILCVIACLLLALLFSPVLVEIDSDRDVYRLRYGFFAEGALVADTNGPALRLRIFGFPRQWGLPSMLWKDKAEASKSVDSAKRKQGRPKRTVSWKKMRAVFKAIEFRQLELDLDTGSYIRNAWLFPVFFLTSKGARKLRINFSGKTIVHANIRAIPARLLWAFIKT